MFRWLAAVLTILIVTLGAVAPSDGWGGPQTRAAAADRDAAELEFEDPEPEPQATLCLPLTAARPSARTAPACLSHRGPREAAALEFEDPPRG